MINMKLGSILAVIGTVDPQTITTAELFTDVVDMGKWDQVIAIAMTGDLATATVDFTAYSCVAAGTSAVSLKACTQLGSSSSANDLQQLVIAVSAAELALLDTGLNHYVKFGLVFSGSGGAGSVLVLGCPNRYDIASVNDLASVAQIKQ